MIQYASESAVSVQVMLFVDGVVVVEERVENVGVFLFSAGDGRERGARTPAFYPPRATMRKVRRGLSKQERGAI